MTEVDQQPILFRHPPKQIAVFRVGSELYAIDNRCPHEGYPLVQGHVDPDCVLTCNWHNWQFRLRDGKCILGGDNVRSYAVREQDGHVWIDLEDPPPAEILGTLLTALKAAFEDRDFGRICREISRLYFNKLDPTCAVIEAIKWSHDRLEFGSTHAYAATADWLAQSQSHAKDWEKQLICLAEAVDHMAFDALRQPRFPLAEPMGPFTASGFAEAIEHRRREEAEGLVRGGLSHGMSWKEMEASFVDSALAHYNDFGHSLIYVHKTSQLLALTGQSMEPYVVPALARHLCYTTREDLLPEFREYADALSELPRFGGPENGQPATGSFFPGTVKESVARLQGLAGQHTPLALFDALLEASARNLIAFDASYGSSYDRPVSDNVGWLDFTHAITFGNAVRNLCRRYPRFWPQGLLQMACFVGRNRRYLDLKQDEAEWIVQEESMFWSQVHETIFDHGQREPIFSAHLLKTATAVEEEIAFASDSCKKYLLAALNRFFHSPLKQKHTRRLARQAIELVSRDFS